MDGSVTAPQIDDAYTKGSSRGGKLRMKASSKRRSHRSHDERSHRRHRSHSRSRSSSPRRSHHRKKRKEPSAAEKDDPSLYDDVYLPGMNSFKYKDPEVAFQESLLEAIADEEGAAYWQGVYGQPIHGYARPEVENERGQLELMTDEEYAAYVRQKMYEKTDEYREKEKRRREKEKEQQKLKDAEERAEWQRKERERLLREKERRLKKSSERMVKAWASYTAAWEAITKKEQPIAEELHIPWPVESGKLKDISRETIEIFLKSAPSKNRTDEVSETKVYVDILRLERVRWHPDKALQRWGRDHVTDEMLQGITAVFQIIDALWTERNGKE